MKNSVPFPRVLVVDDQQTRAEVLAELLAVNGFQTMYATSGMAGLKRVADWKPDAVLTDLSLPDISGHEICRSVRSNPDWDSVAVILYTGSKQSPGYSEHCDAFLTYPIQTAHLTNTIKGSIMRRRQKALKPKTRDVAQAGVPFS